MKYQALHSLVVVCLGSVLFLFLIPTPLNSPEAALPAAPSFGLTPLKTPRSSPKSILPGQAAAAWQVELPATANQTLASYSSDVMAQSHPVMDENLTELHNFIDRVSNNQKDEIRGVYVPRLFALPVTQQPKNNPIFVSNKHDRVTLFQNASRNNVTGLLAHNYLAGSFFQQLAPGQRVLVVYGDGSIRGYRVVSIHHFQKLEPANVRSPLIDLSTGKTLTTAQVYTRFYRGEHHLTFQTCLEHQGRLDWGLTFIVANPSAN